MDWVKQRHLVVLLCGLSSFVCYADRVNISVAVLHMGLEHMERGWVLSSFFYGYFCTQIVGGLLATRYALACCTHCNNIAFRDRRLHHPSFPSIPDELLTHE